MYVFWWSRVAKITVGMVSFAIIFKLPMRCVFRNGTGGQYLCVIVVLCFSQGANELAVQKAKAEITRLIKEELIRLVSAINYTIIIHIFTHFHVFFAFTWL